jgi:hypothetical protein
MGAESNDYTSSDMLLIKGFQSQRVIDLMKKTNYFSLKMIMSCFKSLDGQLRKIDMKLI